MKKLSLYVGVLGAAIAFPAAALVACATDNGDNVHGTDFGPTPTRPEGGAEGSTPGQEGGPTPDPDGGTEGGSEGGPSTCTSGTIAVLAGRGSPTPSLSGAIQDKGGAWVGSAIVGGGLGQDTANADSPPSLVPFGSGFLGVFQNAGDALQSVTYGTSWSTPTTFGNAGVVTAPSLAVVGTSAHVVYSTNLFFHGVYTGTSWDAANEAIGSPQAMGVQPAAVAGAGADVAFAQAGTDNGLYAFTKGAGAWAPYVGPDTVQGVDGAGAVETASPALATVDGKFDVVLVYANKTLPNKLRWVARDATTKTFTAPVDVNASDATYASTLEPIALARIAPLSLLLTFRGTDGKGYYVTGTLGASSITWAPPAPLAAGGLAVDATPRPAKGVCGDDAIIAFTSGGQVKVVRLRGSTLSAPETVTGASGNRVAIATR